MDWLRDHMWEAWLGLAVLLGVAELFSLDLILLMLAVGAVAGVLTALLGLPVAVQILAFVGASVGMLALVRPSVVKRLHSGPDLVTGHAKLVGKQGVVVSEVSAQGGSVRIAGELWSARPYDETLVIEPGAKVDIFEISGATVLVHKIPELDSGFNNG
jgi:membrane protein implicated in regulation of membrane protease activity